MKLCRGCLEKLKVVDEVNHTVGALGNLRCLDLVVSFCKPLPFLLCHLFTTKSCLHLLDLCQFLCCVRVDFPQTRSNSRHFGLDRGLAADIFFGVCVSPPLDDKHILTIGDNTTYASFWNLGIKKNMYEYKHPGT